MVNHANIRFDLTPKCDSLFIQCMLIDGITFWDILGNSGNLSGKRGEICPFLFQVGQCWGYYKPSFAENSHQTMDKDDVHVITREMSRS